LQAPAVGLPYPPPAGELLRMSLLDAACRELGRRRWEDITMSDIARAAGVSRQTLYNEFGSRAEFAQALVLREADRLLDSVELALAQHRSDPARALAAAFDLYLRAAAENPLVSAIVSGEGAGELLALMTTNGEPLLERTVGRLHGLLRAGWPQMTDTDTQLLSGTLVRLAISYTVLPAEPASIGASSVARLLAPYLERLGGREPRTWDRTLL
jgi:AcrR family transcriptional regulator